MKPCLTTETIAMNIDILHDRLSRAAMSALQAAAAMSAGNRNLAIGHLFDLERLLPECDALYRTILLLHRSRHGEGTP